VRYFVGEESFETLQEAKEYQLEHGGLIHQKEIK